VRAAQPALAVQRAPAARLLQEAQEGPQAQGAQAQAEQARQPQAVPAAQQAQAALRPVSLAQPATAQEPDPSNPPAADAASPAITLPILARSGSRWARSSRVRFAGAVGGPSRAALTRDGGGDGSNRADRC
jgi:hypothetical protein